MTERVQALVLNGSGDEKIPFTYLSERGRPAVREHVFEGILPNLERRYRDTESAAVREELAKYISERPCPECGARLEFLLPADFAPPGGPAPETVTVAWRGAAHALRLPRLGDFGPAGLDCTRLGAAPWDEPGFAAAAARALHEADPALALTFAMTCPECGAAFDQLFDPAAYLWAEIEDMSRDLLGQVILLARSFGWSEAAILAMPRARRALYLAGLAEAAP